MTAEVQICGSEPSKHTTNSLFLLPHPSAICLFMRTGEYFGSLLFSQFLISLIPPLASFFLLWQYVYNQYSFVNFKKKQQPDTVVSKKVITYTIFSDYLCLPVTTSLTKKWFSFFIWICFGEKRRKKMENINGKSQKKVWCCRNKFFFSPYRVTHLMCEVELKCWN